jgi:RES domain-containing protein
MFVYRIANIKYKDLTLSGIGAEKVGGRWNRVGTRAVYCSENISLALLEYYIHSQNIAFLPKKILVAKIEIPDEFKIQNLTQLPETWDSFPYTSKSSSIFTDFAKNRDFFALRVPSAIVNFEHNIILNPLFKDFGKVEVVEFIELNVDERLKESERG